MELPLGVSTAKFLPQQFASARLLIVVKNRNAVRADLGKFDTVEERNKFILAGGAIALFVTPSGNVLIAS